MIELFHDIDFEYLESDNSLVIYNDCIESLKKMEADSVDLIFADPHTISVKILAMTAIPGRIDKNTWSGVILGLMNVLEY